jgi:Leishmanolysin/Bacterial Ig-like domain (group 1)
MHGVRDAGWRMRAEDRDRSDRAIVIPADAGYHPIPAGALPFDCSPSMRKILPLAAATLFLWGCGGDPAEPPVATQVIISPASIAMSSIGARQVVHASVLDQRGDAMRDAAIRWTSSSGAATVSTLGGDSAAVTSAGNGTATVTAAAGSVSADVAVTVAQVPTQVRKTGGDQQTGGAGTPLAAQLAVAVTDARGAAVQGHRVTFTVQMGHGLLSSSVVQTDAIGEARATWTLGREAGTTQQVLAVAEGLDSRLEFSATVVAGAPAVATHEAGDQQAALVGAPVPVVPRLRVRDAHGNAVRDIAVQFTVTGGGGSVTGATATTNAIGQASPGSWTLGAAAGTNQLTASFPGTAVPPIVFQATGTVPVPTSIVLAAGGSQAGMAGAALPVTPTFVVRDAAGRPLAGVPVSFAATAGGAVGTASATTNASGIASPGSWTLGPDAGPGMLLAAVQGSAVPTATARAFGCTGGGAGYTMTLCFTTEMTASQRTVFRNAAARWSAIIRADLPDNPVSIPAGACGTGTPSLNLVVDDLVIFAGFENIDGPGDILGGAGWCLRRTGGLPGVGVMRFDAADIPALEASGGFSAVILHEMGHVLGIGASLWGALGLLQSPSPNSGLPLDTHFSGSGAIAAFDQIGGTAYGGGQKVPVHNTGGTGTANSHWRESVFRNELMSPFLNSGSNPLSIVTVRSLADLGYTVDPAAADAFTLTLTAQAPAGPVLHLRDDVYTGPRYTVDRQGRTTRIPN